MNRSQNWLLTFTNIHYYLEIMLDRVPANH